MTQKDYKLIAKAMLLSKPIATDRSQVAQWQYTVRHVVNQISVDNHRFDADKFYKACGYED